MWCGQIRLRESSAVSAFLYVVRESSRHLFTRVINGLEAMREIDATWEDYEDFVSRFPTF